jgi:multicomponent Na+:H+ antiporter subunit E
MTQKSSVAGKAAMVIVMYIFWLLLSASYNPWHGHVSSIHIIVGVVCAVIVMLISHDLLLKGMGDVTLVTTYRMLIYIPWELWQIVLANFDVAYRVLHPSMPIDPLVIEFETTLRSDFSLTTLANSITLTPGTITIDVDPDKGKFLVHAIAKAPADALLVDKTMQEKVAHVFMEE